MLNIKIKSINAGIITDVIQLIYNYNLFVSGLSSKLIIPS